MIRAQDEILMEDHLAVQQSRIEVLGRKLPETEGEVAALLAGQRDLLSEHVNAMQALLSGREPSPPGRHGSWPAFVRPDDLDRITDGRYPPRAASDRHGAAEVVESAWVSRQMAVENLRSALELDDRTAQWVHVGMALDQVEFAIRWMQLARREGPLPAASSAPPYRTGEHAYAQPAMQASRRAERDR